MSKDEKVEEEAVSLVLQEDFKDDDEDKVTAARMIRDLYAKNAENGWGLTDKAVLPGIFVNFVSQALSGLRKKLEQKEDGELITFEWAVVPQAPTPDLKGTPTAALLNSTRSAFDYLATLVSEHVGCKFNYEPYEALPGHEQICFH